MKKLTLIFILLLTHFAYAQVPQGIPYQAAARAANGQALVNTAVKVRFSILDSVATGTTVYQETHSTTTNNVGLFNVNVGMGTPVTGTFSAINWGNNTKFMKMELDITGTGSSYVDMGTQQMLSVPYALYAGSSKVSNSLISPLPSNSFDWKMPDGVLSTLTPITITLAPLSPAYNCCSTPPVGWYNTPYTVPTGYNLYITYTAYNLGSGNATRGVIINNVNINPVSTCTYSSYTPRIAGENMVISFSQNGFSSSPCYFSIYAELKGYLVKKNVNVIYQSTNYTVPVGYKFIVYDTSLNIPFVYVSGSVVPAGTMGYIIAN